MSVLQFCGTKIYCHLYHDPLPDSYLLQSV